MAEAAHNGVAQHGHGVPDSSPREIVGESDGVDGASVDDRAVQLRSEGWSFARIARQLELPEPSSAIVAFKRSLRRRPADERARLVGEELLRLDRLADRVRESSQLDASETDRRLQAVDRIRAFIVAR